MTPGKEPHGARWLRRSGLQRTADEYATPSPVDSEVAFGTRTAAAPLPWRARILTAILAALVPVAAVAGDGLDVRELEFRHGISFFNDLKYPPDYTHLEYLNPDAPKGGMLVLSTGNSFDSFAPLGPVGTNDPGGSTYRDENLIMRSGDEVVAFYTRLADGIALANDRLTLVFRIQPEARWRDGEPVTSKDVVFTFEGRMRDLSWGPFLDFIDSVEAIDHRHVALHLNAPLQDRHLTMIEFVRILPEHYWRDGDPAAVTMVPPLSSGPYTVSAFKPRRYVEYRRDPDYWGRDIPVNKGRYNFDTIRIEVYRDAITAREAFRKGLIDIWTESDARYWHGAFDTPALRMGWVKKIRRNAGNLVGVGQLIVLNARRDKFSDRRVRQALSLAVDFEWQNRALYYGDRQRAQSYWNDPLLTATGLPSGDELNLLDPYRDQLPAEVFERPFRFAEDASSEQYRANVEQARELLAQAGWRIVDGVLANEAGDVFEITFLSQNAADARVLLPYFQRLKPLGIRGAIDRVSGSSEWAKRLREFDFDAKLSADGYRIMPTYMLKTRFHSDGARNWEGIRDPVLDDLIDRARRAHTMSEVIAAYRAIDRVLLWGYYSIPLSTRERPRTVHWDKFGRPAFEPRYAPAFPDGWWYEPKRAARIRPGDPSARAGRR